MKKRATNIGEQGATLVEFALGSSVFVSLTMGLMLLLWISWTTTTLNFAVAKAARWGAVGNTLIDSSTGEPLSRVDSFIARFEEEARAYGLDPSDVTLRICPAALPNCGVNSLGTAGSMILVRAQKPSMNFLGRHTFLSPSCSVLLLNE